MRKDLSTREDGRCRGRRRRRGEEEKGGAGIALLDTRSLLDRAPKENAPPAEWRGLSSGKRREFRLRTSPRRWAV